MALLTAISLQTKSLVFGCKWTVGKKRRRSDAGDEHHCAPPAYQRKAIKIELPQQGLPVGIQIIGPYLEDLTPIQLAINLEKEIIGPYRLPSGYDA